MQHLLLSNTQIFIKRFDKRQFAIASTLLHLRTCTTRSEKCLTAGNIVLNNIKRGSLTVVLRRSQSRESDF
jgi:hypothetical protein